jgi:hypothetical protein
MFRYIIAGIIVLVLTNHLSAQHNNLQRNLNTVNKVKVQSIIFDEIETGILKNDVKSFSQYFSSQPYISLINGVNGYYSSNQAYYIIEDFFKSFKVIDFNFSEKKTEESVSFGKGKYYFEKKGKRESANLYINLTKQGSRWYITQISIN